MTRVLVLAVALVLAPWGAAPVVLYVDVHVDVPYLRDCLFTHPDECVTAGGARG